VHTYAKGDWLWSDFGTAYEGYRSDLARMAVFGKPSDEQRREFDRIWELTRRLIDRVGPGVRCSELARMHSDDMVKMGLPPLEGSKRVGHGFGVTSDPPSIGLADDTVLEPGMILTPEPRYFIPSGQRMHLEEDVVVTAGGHEMLSAGAEHLGVISG
jgi:Xaa-Pro aminopeptidase